MKTGALNSLRTTAEARRDEIILTVGRLYVKSPKMSDLMVTTEVDKRMDESELKNDINELGRQDPPIINTYNNTAKLSNRKVVPSSLPLLEADKSRYCSTSKW